MSQSITLRYSINSSELCWSFSSSWKLHQAMTSPLPMIPDKDRNPSLSSEQDSQRVAASSSRDAPTKTPRNTLQIATPKDHDQPSNTAHCGSEESPTTPSSVGPTLHTNEERHSDAQPSSKETSVQFNIASPATSTFSRAPTIGESDRQPGVLTPGDDSERSTSGIPGGESPKPTSGTFQRIRSIRWQGVLAMIAGVFAQMLCWGLINCYGTILAFVSLF